MKGLVVLLDLFLHIVSIYRVQALHIYEEPASQNITLGSSAKFTCNISGNTAVFWYVDGVYHNDMAVKARGISSVNNYEEVSDSSKSILTVTGDEQNNNTLLQCSGFDGEQFVYSSTVVLRIQGKLAAVSGLMGIQTASNEVVFNWSIPYSLEGVPVLGYQVHVVIASNLNGYPTLSNNESITKTMSYAVSKPSTIICAYVNITVYGENDVGLGEPVDYNFKLTESPVSVNWTIVDIHKQFVNDDLWLVGELEAVLDCFQATPSSASLTINDESMLPRTCNTPGSDHIQLKDDNATMTLVITLDCSPLSGYGSSYIGNLVLYNIGGSFSIPGIKFDTYVLKNATLTVGLEATGELCITCVFVLNVNNRYCCFYLEDNSEYSFTSKIFQDNGSNNGTTCITGLATGVYSVHVCNADCNVNSTFQPLFHFHNFAITEKESSSSYTSTFLYVSSLSSLQTSIQLPSPTRNDNDSVVTEMSKVTVVVILGSSVIVIPLIVVILIIAMCTLYKLRKKRNNHMKFKADPMVSRNEAYSSVFVQRRPDRTAQVIETNPCSAYGVIGK